MAVNVKSQHPDYITNAPLWTLMRHTVDGEESVKGQNELYLPIPSGFKQNPLTTDAAYHAYKTRAQFPDIVSATIRGMIGVIHRRPAQIRLPSQLNHLVEKASLDGMPLDSLHRRITREVLINGRYGINVDIDKTGKPYLAGYTAESITNWGERSEDKELRFVVLDESGYKFHEDTFDWELDNKWRVLKMEGENHAVEIHEEGVNLPVTVTNPNRFGGKKLPFIPFVFIDTNDLTPEPDEVPLIGLGRTSLAIYRLDADYRHQLYMTGQEMWIYIGIRPEDAPDMVGSGAAVTLPIGGDAKVVGPQGRGIEAHRLAIAEDFDRAVLAGAKLFADQMTQPESGHAIRLRTENQTATLTSISKNTAAGLERALRYAAIWVGANPEEVVVEPNLEFSDVRLNPQDVQQLVAAWQAEAFSKLTLHENLKRGGIVPVERTLDQEQELINKEILDGVTTPIEDEAALTPPVPAPREAAE